MSAVLISVRDCTICPWLSALGSHSSSSRTSTSKNSDARGVRISCVRLLARRPSMIKCSSSLRDGVGSAILHLFWSRWKPRAAHRNYPPVWLGICRIGCVLRRKQGVGRLPLRSTSNETNLRISHDKMRAGRKLDGTERFFVCARVLGSYRALSYFEGGRCQSRLVIDQLLSDRVMDDLRGAFQMQFLQNPRAISTDCFGTQRKFATNLLHGFSHCQHQQYLILAIGERRM